MTSNETGLAFSGGGIRSAALCSGVLRRLLKDNAKVDYLSCVSGGGYTGTSFLDWKKRKEKKTEDSKQWHEEFFENMRQRAGYFCNWEKPCQGILDAILMFLLVLTVTVIELIIIRGSYAFPLAFVIDYLFGKLLRAKVNCDHFASTSSPSNPNATAQEIRKRCQKTVVFTMISLFSVLLVLFVIFFILSQTLSRRKSRYFRLFSLISFLLLSLTFLPFAIHDFFIEIPLWSRAIIVVIGVVLWFLLPLLRDKTSYGILIYLYPYIIYWKVYEAKVVGVVYSDGLFNKLLFASGFIMWFVPYLAQSRKSLSHVFNRWRLQKAFYSKESLATKGCLEILHDIVCPLWTCLKRKQKQQSLEDDPANERSLKLADLRDLEPKYISNMTIHSWKKEEDSDSDDDLLTMSPTTIECWKKEEDSDSDDDLLTMSRTTIKDKLRPRDIELSDAMATSAAAISRYDNNFEVLRLSTILGLEMGATVISNFEAIKKEGWLMKLLPILINILRGLPLIAVPAVYYGRGDVWSIKAGVFTFFAIHPMLACIGAFAVTGAEIPSLWEKIASPLQSQRGVKFSAYSLKTSDLESLYGGPFTLSTQLTKPNHLFIVHVSFVQFVREGLNIENIGPMPPPVMLLSDGGHVENLAILPLLKKKLKKIIVVDGGYYSNEMKYGKYLLRAGS
ncbi:unnamed protein product [Pocillopora meandrina]|uniref:PNPLA domain-containing protein n=1 Tax=Pocillopora meandrina TaxID=46732 RepID=A0AAU9WJ81_9CNID|nr:unnamed protein product [Pocillopora meandrina]